MKKVVVPAIIATVVTLAVYFAAVFFSAKPTIAILVSALIFIATAFSGFVFAPPAFAVAAATQVVIFLASTRTFYDNVLIFVVTIIVIDLVVCFVKREGLVWNKVVTCYVLEAGVISAVICLHLSW